MKEITPIKLSNTKAMLVSYGTKSPSASVMHEAIKTSWSGLQGGDSVEWDQDGDGSP